MGAVSGYLFGSLRELSAAEIKAARGVFGSTIPYSVVAISDDVGGGGRPYTSPAGFCYRLHLGPHAYANPASNLPLLIHELTHVWQGHHHFFTWGYVFNSLWHQAIDGSNAYNYTAGQPWRDYNVEQQAKIVEDWFVNGQQTSDPLYQYIRDNIRRPTLSWASEMIP
jgi:hypothetical protein